jgi:hypothetical protein
LHVLIPNSGAKDLIPPKTAETSTKKFILNGGDVDEFFKKVWFSSSKPRGTGSNKADGKALPRGTRQQGHVGSAKLFG